MLVFELAGETAAVPIESAKRIVHMARLARPPGLPSPLVGVLNLAGAAVPVLRLERLLQLPEASPGLFSMLIVLKGIAAQTTALLVDRVNEVLSVPESDLVRAGEKTAFNRCSEASVTAGGRIVHLLSPERILLEEERRILSDYQAVAQERLEAWETRGGDEKRQ